MRIDRPMERYLHYGLGPHACLGGKASQTALTAMLRVVGKLDNLRRAAGPQGQLKKMARPGGFYTYMRADHGSYFPFPTSELRADGREKKIDMLTAHPAMKINWDGDLPKPKKM